MDELGIQMVFALSPQAKGRVERTAGTFQDRLVTELRLAGAVTIEEANAVLKDDVYDPAAPTREQLVDAGQLQPVGGQPLVDLLGPGGEQIVGRRLNPPGTRKTQPRQAGQLLLARSRTVTGQAASMYLRTVARDSPVPVAICRWLMPDCQRRTTSVTSTLDTSLYAIAAPYIQDAAMVANPALRVVNLLAKWPIVPGDLSFYWYIVPGV